jgi:hypothetical protein
MNTWMEFVPLAAAVGIVLLVLLLELPRRRFAFAFLWAALGILLSRPVSIWILRSLDLHGLKARILIQFQSASVLAITAIGVGEWLRRAGVFWRPLLASLGILSVPMTMLASYTLNGGGPNRYDLGEMLVWVATAGYVVGPAALAAFVYVIGVHRIELIKELGHD